jgi:hypothetical protein
MELPEAGSLRAAGDRELMRHQARFVEEVKSGHRTFLLADEPGLGKTAQSLLAAAASNSYPLLVVVPNVVKTNWAREVELWTPGRTATVVHGDGHDVDAFSDVVIVNYEILDRHVGWLGRFGFKGMVVDEAHFIKNLKSERSKHVLALSRSIRATYPRALMMALTGTPLINSIEDFRAIWQFLGWIDDKKPLAPLMDKLEDTGLTRPIRASLPRRVARVVEMGIVRRKKVDVAADIPPVASPTSGRARRRVRPLDPRRRGRAHRAPARPVPSRARDQARREHRRSHPRGRPRRARGVEGRQHRRERLHDGAPHRSGQGVARRGLHGPARPLGRQGRVLRQAHRRDGRGRGALREGRAHVRLDPRRPVGQGPAGGDRPLRQRPRRLRRRREPHGGGASASTCRPRRTSCSPS